MAGVDMNEHPPVWHAYDSNPMPVKVVLVSFASDSEAGRAFVDRMLRQGYESTSIIDLDSVLVEPFDLPHIRQGMSGMDGSFATAQRFAMCNAEYPATVHAVLCNSMRTSANHVRIFVRTDHTGIKSDVVCRVEEEILNKLTCDDGHGATPLFKARPSNL